MVIVAKTNVLAVGLADRIDALQELPIRLICLQNGSEAISSLKTEQYHSVISHWHLVDMSDGGLLKGLRGIRPEMPTIAVIQANNPTQEILARSLGVSAVITEDCPDEHFRTVVCGVLGLRNEEVLEEIYAVNEVK